MQSDPKQQLKNEYPPTRELWSVLGIALGGGMLWMLGGFVRNISLGMLDDPVVGCSSLGCAPGLVNFASLFLYLAAILLWGFSYIGLLSFVRLPVAIMMMVLGGVGTLAALIGLFLAYDNRIVGAGLIAGPIILLSGILAYTSRR